MSTLFVIGGTFVLTVIPGVAENVILVPVVGIPLIPNRPPWINWLRLEAKPGAGVDGRMFESELVVFRPASKGAPPKLFWTDENVWPGANAVVPTFEIDEETTILDQSVLVLVPS